MKLYSMHTRTCKEVIYWPQHIYLEATELSSRIIFAYTTVRFEHTVRTQRTTMHGMRIYECVCVCVQIDKRKQIDAGSIIKLNCNENFFSSIPSSRSSARGESA